ncbi:MAG TPA: lysophospholipid acyltransferase family protein [Bacteroidales bacterium]|nr:lysophospholipid acyltransferase family protein [Bacteroidales bacterium]
METVGFYIFFAFNWIVTLLPLSVLYLFSDLIFVILYYFPSYRRDIVDTNLRNAFPGKSPEERKLIARKYYRHLADLFVEVMKITHMSGKQLKKRFVINDLDLLDRLYEKNKDIVAVMAHYNNWEWLTILSAMTRYKTVSIYKPLHNKNFNKLINSYRSKFGMVLTPMNMIVREIIDDRKKNILTLSAFINDQIPAKGDIRYWAKFLNQDTAIYLGAEKIAAKYNMSLVYFHVQKLKRGYYCLNIDLLFEDTAGLPEGAITEAHLRKLENIITENPEYWLWSHRRWKHKKHENA